MKGLSVFYAILASILLLSFSDINAQSDHEKCAYVNATQAREAQYPGYLEAVNRTFEEAKARGEESRLGGGNEVYTINVVVHIVHVTSNAQQNIADSIIEDQIRILNEDFRRMNADAGNLRSIFEPIAGDPLIEFQLAQVKRVGTPNIILPDIITLSYDDIKDSSKGGSDAVDPEHFLNIWVAELFPGLVLGYAYPPAGLSHWPAGASAPSPGDDGVLIDYRAFGSNNPASSFYEGQGVTIQGRTTVHEVGHYLGLRHIWGDGDCNEDDGMDDTPAMSENSQESGCDPSKNTCDDGPGDLPDMWENYMDYSDETCQVAFSVDQIDVMRGVLEGPRAGLLGTVTCTAPTTGDVSGAAAVTESTTETYSAPSTSNTFDWFVVGGTIETGQGTNSITVEWGAGPTGLVCLTESDMSCIGNQECVSITVSAGCSAPTTGSISGNTTPNVSATETYSIPATANTIEWVVTGGTLTGGAGTNSITVNWGTGSNGSVCVTESDGSCTGNQECENITLTTISGISEIAYEKGLSVYPNPATSYIHIKSNEIPERVDLINVLGATVASYDGLSLINRIELGNISDKILFVKVQFEDGFALERIIVE